ncbi:uncharacterized protein FIBRA_01378 [Fibroporia radiculosa]|uniref:RNase III domain-containing protein n=1 Tax=Fibroporia radiculosa TaxID=599839 RepID=J4GK03_9APHY|nr:uncharacterized protein FIBRA_01378 [Fibroporia radiculosa]CCL99360.1 predicted protein [Fibroporia radiculosa]
MSRGLSRVLSPRQLARLQWHSATAGQRLQLRFASNMQQSPRPSGHAHPPPPATPRQNDPSGSASDFTGLQAHLDTVFSPLKFPPELAARILTHASHPDALQRHNARLSFIGRRVLQSYLMLFLHSSPELDPSQDYTLITERALNTYILGEYVAPRWSLGKVLRWVPVNIGPLKAGMVEKEGVASVVERLSPSAGHSIGLYKVQGGAVEALVGGVFHQFGGNVAHRLFHTRVLPHILLPGSPDGLRDAFHPHAMQICESMGGLNGDLLGTFKTGSESS